MIETKEKSVTAYSSEKIAEKVGRAKSNNWKSLDLFHCNVEDEDLHKLLNERGVEQLRKLYLDGNLLSTIPSEIGRLTALTWLSLGGNQISVLPPEIGQLSALTELHLGMNLLSTLPRELQQLTALKGLYLHDNESLDLPEEILGPAWLDARGLKNQAARPANILDYCFHARDGSNKPHAQPVKENSRLEEIPGDAKRVFFSSAHEDEKWRNQLMKMLAPVLRRKMLDVWLDSKIKPGQDWRKEIEEALQRTHVGVLLISMDSLASDFIATEEIPFLIEAADRSRVKLSWVLIGDCLWEREPIARLQALHDPKKPLSSCPANIRSFLLKQIANGILELAQ